MLPGSQMQGPSFLSEEQRENKSSPLTAGEGVKYIHSLDSILERLTLGAAPLPLTPLWLPQQLLMGGRNAHTLVPFTYKFPLNISSQLESRKISTMWPAELPSH
ncbi:protein bicaudal D-like protein 2-like [Platysternon megacephalum]|uniref:Protein bicaudal D-like protein 2-like n=1 Tax=Platysternon megacephalum TaxID=55544 RepID=A0A4D9DQF9_9SAUR|nr:protein bicaudal D-like protein 2-like [Platysternon megacephalum]